jgi:hypothetical protein
MRKELIRTGVVAEFEGRYWGIQYEDGHSTEYDFGPIQNARISDPQYCKKPEDMTYAGDYNRPRLQKAKLVAITVTTIYETRPHA